MSSDKDADGNDWLSAPVGKASEAKGSSGASGPTGPSTGVSMATSTRSGSGKDADSIPTYGPVSESITASGSKYKSSFTQNLVSGSGSLYPTAGSTPSASPALDAEPSPGPATSVGLGSAATSTTNRVRRSPSAGPRRAKLQIRHIDPWSTLKLSLVLAVAFFFVWMIAVAILYGVLSTMGVFESIDSMFAELGASEGGGFVTPRLVFGGAALIGAINIVLFTALATIGAYIYNLCADLAGGLEITLAERR
ncbi:DUF3566 domain-containing protein [Blastococcus sp. Marseille-P5729]|uniref:DUF3566 domain-containing protein n=1 Tax=Blastococcus sp. Marseille-P5729 TaxID=2086582 RepID=UPI001F32BEE9|nr:DUF3566 domain-containing protein [Blastococcus sp. Marseille-P5729]